MTVVLGELAVEDLRRARDHYARIDPALSQNFADASDTVISRIGAFPHGAPPVEGFPGLRRARMRRFPYRVSTVTRPIRIPSSSSSVLPSSRDTGRQLDD